MTSLHLKGQGPAPPLQPRNPNFTLGLGLILYYFLMRDLG